jgi:phosphomannomutase
MIKIVAFDLDGTLAESKQPLSEDMKNLLKRLSKLVKIAIISGASFAQLRKQVVPEKNFILLPVNGSQCYEYANGDWKLTDEELFPEDIKKNVIDELEKIINDSRFNIPDSEEIFGEYIDDRGTQITLSAMGQEAPISEKEIWDPDQKKRLEIREEILKKIKDVDVSIAGMTSIDILPRGRDKAHGLIKLLDRYWMKKKEMIFIGDAVFPGGNDFSPQQAHIKTIKVKDPHTTAEVIKRFIDHHATI